MERYKYIVKPEDGVVVCILSTTWRDHPVVKFNRKYEDLLRIPLLIEPMPEKFKGIARCDLELDQFDVNFGKKLARERADAKYQKFCRRINKKIFERLTKAITGFSADSV